jgi:hypothetical protein
MNEMTTPLHDRGLEAHDKSGLNIVKAVPDVTAYM